MTDLTSGGGALASSPSLPYLSRADDLRDADLHRRGAEDLDEEERLEFFSWIANDPSAGEVVPGSGGCRKVRWARAGMGKRGGARVIYFARLAQGELCMLLVYPKSTRDNIPASILKQVRKELEDAIE